MTFRKRSKRYITQHVNGPEETSLAASVLVGGALVDVHALGSPNDL